MRPVSFMYEKGLNINPSKRIYIYIYITMRGRGGLYTKRGIVSTRRTGYCSKRYGFEAMHGMAWREFDYVGVCVK